MTKAPGGCRTCPGCHYSTKILYYTSRLRGRRGSEKVEDGRLDVVNAQIGRNPKLRTKILYCMTVLLRGRRYNRVKKAQGFQEAGPGRGKTLDQNEPVFSTADRLAKEHGRG
jgi:hypothetical protein